MSMPLFSWPFKRRTYAAIVCVDIGANTIGGAYTVFQEQSLPHTLYAKRVPIIAHSGEEPGAAMIRALEVLGVALTREGAPALLRAMGSGHISGVLVSLDAPWQTTVLRTETIEEKSPFVFTKHTARTMLAQRTEIPNGMTLVNESIIGTLLNGYETRQPYGKRAHRATIMALSSFVRDEVLAPVAATLRALYHIRVQFSITGSSLRYQAIREIFPHENDAILLDAIGTEVSVTLIRRGLLVASLETPCAPPGSPEWTATTTNLLRQVAVQYPLPRTIFILAEDTTAAAVTAACRSPLFGSIWLTEKPPKLVFVRPSHLAALVTSSGTPDVVLSFMAIYWRRHEVGLRS